MKTKIALALAGILPISASAELFISEYIEGSSYNKAVEIFNPSNNDIDLANYQIKLFQNANNTSSYTINLSGTISAGGTFVVAHQSIADDNDVDLLVNNLQHNGNDSIVLYNDGNIIDSIGKIGENVNWSNNGVSTKDKTLVRKSDIATGDSDPNDAFDPSVEWIAYPKNTFSYLGSHTFTGVIDDNDGGGNDGGNDGDDGDGDTNVPSTCGDTFITINQIQGTAGETTINGDIIWVEGIVTQDLQDTGYSGFYLQSLTNDVDKNTASSEGIFVYNTSFAVNVGDHVRLNAKAGEYASQTQLSNLTDLIVCSSSNDMPSATAVELPLSSEQRETLEGMLITFNQDLFVTDTYNYGRYGQIGLASERLYNPTQIATPGEAANTLASLNNSKSIVLDDLSTEQNPASLPYPSPELTPDNTLRSGNTMQNVTGVLGYSYGNWMVLPTQGINVIQTNPRTSAPSFEVEGNVRVASFNVLNYFNGNGEGAGFPTPRGANNAQEFSRQRDKIINAIAALDADIIGLMEIENDGFGELSAIADLVNGLNAQSIDAQYEFITPAANKIGTDEISVGLIYRADIVAPNEVAKILDSNNSAVDQNNQPLFIDNKNRPVLAQSFTLLSNEKTLAVAVAHYKSKGSDCDELGDPDMNDGQGDCNLIRTKAAQATAQFLQAQYAQTPTLLIGDLNAYAKEDPITALINNGYDNVFESLEKTDTYSYIYSGELGQLDHAMANDLMTSHILDAQFWPINADEPRVLDYNLEFQDSLAQQKFYAPDAYRSSDHDPVVIEINLVPQEVFGDFDNDLDVDRNDVSIFYQMLRRQSITDMRFDFNNDGFLNTRDVRGLMSLCTRASCAI